VVRRRDILRGVAGFGVALAIAGAILMLTSDRIGLEHTIYLYRHLIDR
jgi:L-lactate permease